MVFIIEGGSLQHPGFSCSQWLALGAWLYIVCVARFPRSGGSLHLSGIEKLGSMARLARLFSKRGCWLASALWFSFGNWLASYFCFFLRHMARFMCVDFLRECGSLHPCGFLPSAGSLFALRISLLARLAYRERFSLSRTAQALCQFHVQLNQRQRTAHEPLQELEQKKDWNSKQQHGPDPAEVDSGPDIFSVVIRLGQCSRAHESQWQPDQIDGYTVRP
jgi:hypothetical protein